MTQKEHKPVFSDWIWDYEEWSHTLPEDPMWIIQNLLPRNAFMVVGGEPKKAKKSMSMFAMLLSVCNGTFGDPETSPFVVDPDSIGPVLVVEEEGAARPTHQRMQYLCKALGGSVESLMKGKFFWSHQSGFKLDGDPRWVNELIEFVNEKKIRVVVLDSFARVHNKDENNSQHMSYLMDKITRILSETETSVVLIHHVNKGGGEDPSYEDFQRNNFNARFPSHDPFV